MDWSAADPELVKEIIREAEAYLQAQQALALSADQRSSVMASLFTATAVAIVAGLMTLLSSERAESHIAIYYGGFFTLVLLVAAASLCIWSARPVGFGIVGNEPQSWYDDVRNPRDMTILLGEQAENYQAQITQNNARLVSNSIRFKWGAFIGIAAPIAGLLVWAVAGAKYGFR